MTGAKRRHVKSTPPEIAEEPLSFNQASIAFVVGMAGPILHRDFQSAVRDVSSSAVFNTALASGRGRTAMGENGQGSGAMVVRGWTRYFSWQDVRRATEVNINEKQQNCRGRAHGRTTGEGRPDVWSLTVTAPPWPLWPFARPTMKMEPTARHSRAKAYCDRLRPGIAWRSGPRAHVVNQPHRHRGLRAFVVNKPYPQEPDRSAWSTGDDERVREPSEGYFPPRRH